MTGPAFKANTNAHFFSSCNLALKIEQQIGWLLALVEGIFLCHTSKNIVESRDWSLQAFPQLGWSITLEKGIVTPSSKITCIDYGLERNTETNQYGYVFPVSAYIRYVVKNKTTCMQSMQLHALGTKTAGSTFARLSHHLVAAFF